MTVDNGVAHNGDTFSIPNFTVSLKKSREIERRRRRRKQKKNISRVYDISEEVVVEYVPEQPEFEDGFDDEFRKIFDKFNFLESVASEEDDKKGESEEKADVKKFDSDSDSDEEDQDNQNKEKGISNKKKKLQRRMKIAELK